MNTVTQFRIDESQRDRWTVWLGSGGPGVNVLNRPIFDDLNRLLDQWESSSSDLPIVFRSDNPTGFIVGADIKAMAKMAQESEIRQFLSYGQQTMQRLGNLQRRTIAVIQGACLGGGLEFALSCRYRLGCENGRTMLGLPETKLGLLPGWGGTQWLVPLSNIELAVRMLLFGDPITLEFAHENGLVDEVTVEGTEETDLSHFLQGIANQPLRPSVWETKDASNPRGSELVRQAKSIAETEFAPLTSSQQAIMKALIAGLEANHTAGLQMELDLFFPRLMSEEAQNAFARFRK